MILLVVYYLQDGIVGFAKNFYFALSGKTKPARPIKDTNQAQAPIITGPSNVLGTR